MKILIVNRFFGGAQIPTGRMAEDVARVLVEAGYEVTALASTGTYVGAEKRAQHGAGKDGVSVGRCCGVSVFTELPKNRPTELPGPRGTLRVEEVRVPKWMPRALAWVWFTWQARQRIPRMDWDVCVLMTDPPLLPLLSKRAKAAGVSVGQCFGRAVEDERLKHRRTETPPHRATRRVAVWLMDLYPEALAASGRLGPSNPLYKWYFSRRQQSLAAADLLICLGDQQRTLLGEALTRGVRTAVVPPWDDREEVVRADDCRLENLALYAGNLGEAHCFEEILAAAPYLPPDWTIRFAVRGAKLAALRAKASHREFSHSRPEGTGDGPKANSARYSRGQIDASQRKASHGLTRMKGRISPGDCADRTKEEGSCPGTPGNRGESSDKEMAEAQEGAASLLVSSSFGLSSSLGARVEITGYASEEETPELLASARVHLITMSPGWEGIVVPSKLYGCIRTGRPALFIGPENADTAREIRAHDWGKVLPAGASGEEVAAAILELAARPTRATQSENGAKKVAQLIQGLATD